MTKKIGVVCAVVAFAALSTVVALYEPSPPQRSVVFTVLPVFASNNTAQTCTVIVSNASDHTVVYTEGFGRIWFDVDYKSNAVWQHYRIETNGGPALLQPHGVKKNSITVPAGATEIRVGMELTSLTWKGQLAFRIFRSNFGGSVRPIIHFLLVQDESKRSRTEWSETFSVSKQ
jgi:hypothetical protein